MLRLAGVSYRYPGFATPALREVTLELRPGEIVGVVGANESGKSTLCLVASGLAPGSIGGELTTGSVEIDDRPTAGRPLHELATQVGIGFQNPATQLSGVAGSVFEEVALGPMDLGLPARETVERTRAAVLAYFNATDDYTAVFTSNASGALKGSVVIHSSRPPCHSTGGLRHSSIVVQMLNTGANA